MRRSVHLLSLLLTCGLLADPTPATATETPSAEYLASVEELMRLSGASEIGNQMATNLMLTVSASLRQAHPALPNRAFEIVQEVTSETLAEIFDDKERLNRDYAAIYVKHFTKAEIDEIIAFYRTPTGQKAVRTMPSIVQEAMILSQQWVREAQPRMQAELQRRLTEEGVFETAP